MASCGRSTFAFDDNFVLVLTSPPNLEVQVLDETNMPRQTLFKRLVVVGLIAYKGLSMLLKQYLKD